MLAFFNSLEILIMKRKYIVRVFTSILLATFIFALSAETFAQKKPKKKARKLARVADKLYNNAKFGEAIDKYAEALSVSPIFPKARFYKGSSHFKQNQFDLAVDELNLALEQGFTPLKVYSVRMEANAAKGNFLDAMEDAKKVVKQEPDTAYHNYFFGSMLIANKEFQRGVDSLNKSVDQGIKDPNVYYFLTLGYNGLGDYLKQEISADKALKSGTQFSGNSHFLLADAYQRNRKYTDAIQSYKNAINNYKGLIETNRALVDTEENLYQAYVNLGDVYRNVNRFDEAIDTAKDGLALRLSDKNLHISLTWYYSLAGKREEAIIAGKRAVQLAPEQYMSYTNLCRAYNDEGEFFYSRKASKLADTSFNNAVEQCKKALQLEPNDGETNYYLGRAYFYLDNEKLSKDFYKKSVNGLIRFTEANPDYSDGFYLLGNAYFATGQNAEAIAAYEKCLKITPRFARVRYNLGYVYFQEGNKDAAREQHALLEKIDGDLAARLLGVIDGK